jgi:hypothetical protein
MSTGAQGAASPKRIEDDMLPNNKHERVLNALVNRKSLAFLELTSLCGLEDNDLRSVISWFETRGMVSVSSRNDIFEEVVTLREKGFGLARKLDQEREFQVGATA